MSDDSSAFPDLPLMCLSTARATSTLDLVVADGVSSSSSSSASSSTQQVTTVIDFWTTRCTRCPAALDQLDALAAATTTTAKNVQIVSICCGETLDGARSILEQSRQRRWPHLQHYYMAQGDKEIAKRVLGFAAVPFYVVVDDTCSILCKGNKVNVAQLLQDLQAMQEQELADEKENMADTAAAPRSRPISLTDARNNKLDANFDDAVAKQQVANDEKKCMAEITAAPWSPPPSLTDALNKLQAHANDDAAAPDALVIDDLNF